MPQTVFTQTFTVTLSDQSPDLENKFDTALARMVAVNPRLSVSDLVVGECSDELVETDQERSQREAAELQAERAEQQKLDQRAAKFLELKGWLFGENEKKQLGLPSAWDQEHWGIETSCGTQACIAGKTVLDAGGEFVNGEVKSTGVTYFSEARMPDGEIVHIETQAAKLLGLEHFGEYNALFKGGNDYAAAAAVIDALIAGEDADEARREVAEDDCDCTYCL